MCTPAAASRSTSARLRGSSANARTDARDHRADVGDRLRAPRPARPGCASMRPNVPRERRAPPSRRRGGCRGRRPAATGRSPAALDLLDHVAADLAQLARHGSLRSRLLRRDDQVLELLDGRGVEVGEVAHQPLLDRAGRPATRPAPRCSSRVRDAKCSRLRRSRAGHDAFSQRQTTSSSSR